MHITYSVPTNDACAEYEDGRVYEFNWQLKDTPIIRCFAVRSYTADKSKACVLEEMTPEPPACKRRRHFTG